MPDATAGEFHDMSGRHGMTGLDHPKSISSQVDTVMAAGLQPGGRAAGQYRGALQRCNLQRPSGEARSCSQRVRCQVGASGSFFAPKMVSTGWPASGPRSACSTDAMVSALRATSRGRSAVSALRPVGVGAEGRLAPGRGQVTAHAEVAHPDPGRDIAGHVQRPGVGPSWPDRRAAPGNRTGQAPLYGPSRYLPGGGLNLSCRAARSRSVGRTRPPAALKISSAIPSNTTVTYLLGQSISGKTFP
jgi:hypothetical protein